MGAHRVQIGHHDCMQSMSVRIDVDTHRELKRLASSLGASVGETVALAVRRLRQDQMGAELRTETSGIDRGWLDPDLG